MSQDEEQMAIDLPPFDEGATRRAVRRAVVRTAITAIGGLLVLLIVASIGSDLWSARTKDRLRFIMGRAYQAANPGYLINFSSGPRSRWDFGTDLNGNAQALEPSGFSNASTNITLRQSFYGRITQQTILTPTHIDELFCCVGRSDKLQAPRLLRELPAAVEFSALVELKTPLDETTFTAFRHRIGICGRDDIDTFANIQEAEARHIRETNACGGNSESQTAELAAMILSPTQQVRLAENPGKSLDGAHRLTWPDFSLVEFDRWATALRASDEANMRKLLLPGVEEIKRRARDGKIYGFIVTGLRPDRLSALLKAPEFGDVTIADVALSIS